MRFRLQHVKRLDSQEAPKPICTSRILAAQLSAVRDASEADDKVDADNDGIADAEQVDSKKLAVRKLDLALRVVDPEVVMRAIGGLWTAYLGVLTVLKLQFAQTVALAQSIGETLRPTMAKVVGPTVVAVTPAEYRKWISPAINLTCKALAGFVAWKIQKLISTVQSGFSGGMMVSCAILALLRQRQLITVTDDQTYMDELMGWSIGACGIYVQVVKGGPVPSIFSPLLWPLDAVEMVLKWHVTWMSASPKGERTVSK